MKGHLTGCSIVLRNADKVGFILTISVCITYFESAALVPELIGNTLEIENTKQEIWFVKCEAFV